MAKIDVSGWKEFHLYDKYMFAIDTGNKFDLGKMNQDIDEINFVGRTGVNNGVNAVCGKISGVEPYPEGYLTVVH